MPRRDGNGHGRGNGKARVGDEGLSSKILEELIYERVRVTVDLCELMAFEMDLAASIERALLAVRGTPAERSDLAMEYLQRAWQRLSDTITGEILDREHGGARAGPGDAAP
jgi:hypothetical protein